MIKPRLERFHDQLEFRMEGDQRLIFDPVRKKYVKVQPEELVRQSWISYLREDWGINPAVLAVEKTLKLNNLSRRYDLVLYRKSKPFVLFEFKSFSVKLSTHTAFQAAQYNLVLQVPYIIISNGMSHYAFHIKHLEKTTEPCENLSFLKI